jgi:hypothetical protein
MADNPKDASSSDPPLIFHWEPVRGVRRRLLGWGLLCTLAMAGLFYFLKVPALPSRAGPPPQQSMTYLPGETPPVRALLSALQDRFPSSLLEAPQRDIAADADAIAALIPAWKPAWSAPFSELRPFAHPLMPTALPAASDLFGKTMTPLATSDPLPGAVIAGWHHPPTAESPAPPPLPAPVVVERSPLTPRTIEHTPTWPSTTFDESWPTSGSVPFILGIDATGRVVYCWSDQPQEGRLHESIRRRLVEYRFSASHEALTWWQVVVQW